MSYTKIFIEKLEESEFQKPYTKSEQLVIYARTEDKFKEELFQAIKNASSHVGLKISIFDKIRVSADEVMVGEIVIQIFRKEK